MKNMNIQNIVYYSQECILYSELAMFLFLPVSYFHCLSLLFFPAMSSGSLFGTLMMLSWMMLIPLQESHQVTFTLKGQSEHIYKIYITQLHSLFNISQCNLLMVS